MGQFNNMRIVESSFETYGITLKLKQGGMSSDRFVVRVGPSAAGRVVSVPRRPASRRSKGATQPRATARVAL